MLCVHIYVCMAIVAHCIILYRRVKTKAQCPVMKDSSVEKVVPFVYHPDQEPLMGGMEVQF